MASELKHEPCCVGGLCVRCSERWPCLTTQLGTMAADLAKATARADALAVENAELRAALDSVAGVFQWLWTHLTLIDTDASVRSKEAEERIAPLLAADPARRGADLLAAADRLGEAVQRWLDDPDVDATQAETDLLGDAYGEWINCRLRGGRGPEGGA
jgi:hypothetical protein